MEPPDPDYILRGFDGPVTSLAFIPNSRDCGDNVSYLIAGTQTGSLFVWSLKTRRVVHRMMSIHANSVLSITVLGDGDREVLSQGREGVVIRWKLLAIDNWLKLGVYPCGDLGFAPVAVLRLGDKSVIAASTSSEQSHVSVMVMDGGEMVTTLKPQQTVGMLMDIKAGREDLIMAGYEDGSIIAWDIRIPHHEKNSVQLHNEAVSSFDYCEQTQRGISASVDGSLLSWGGMELKSTATADIKGGAACVRARPDGKLFAIGGCDSRIHIYSGRPKLLPLAVVCAHTQSVQSLAFNDCDQTFAAGSRDKTVSMWSIYKDS